MSDVAPQRFKLPPMVESVFEEILAQWLKLPVAARKSRDVNVLFLDLLMTEVYGFMISSKLSSLKLDFRSNSLGENDCLAIENFMQQAPMLGRHLGGALMTTSAPIIFLHEVAALFIDVTGGDGNFFWTACWLDADNKSLMEEERVRLSKN